jgi:hypothetical protein
VSSSGLLQLLAGVIYRSDNDDIFSYKETDMMKIDICQEFMKP